MYPEALFEIQWYDSARRGKRMVHCMTVKAITLGGAVRKAYRDASLDLLALMEDDSTLQMVVTRLPQLPI